MDNSDLPDLADRLCFFCQAPLLGTPVMMREGVKLRTTQYISMGPIEQFLSTIQTALLGKVGLKSREFIY